MLIKMKMFSDINYHRKTITYTVEGIVNIGTELKSISAKGVAMCNPTDEYDKAFGITLAQTRALQKYYKKYEKALINHSYKNSRKNTKTKELSNKIDKEIAKIVCDACKKYISYLKAGEK